MFYDWAERSRAVAATERKAIDRWFSPSPVGLLFHGEDGTARPIAPDVAERYKRRAMADFDAFLEEETAHLVLSVAAGIAAAIIGWCVADLFGWSKAGVFPLGFGAGMAFLHSYPLIRLAMVRRRHKALRREIAESLRATAPVPATIAERYRRRNPWKIALEIVMAVVLVFTMVAMHDERLLTAIPMWLYLAVVPVAWGLFGLSKYVDAHQDRQPR